MAEPPREGILPAGLFASSLNVSMSYSLQELGPEAARTMVEVAKQTHVIPIQTAFRWTSFMFLFIPAGALVACISTHWNTAVVIAVFVATAGAFGAVARKAMALLEKKVRGD